MTDIILPYKEIPLTRGKVSLVDAADYEWLMQWKWFARKEVRSTGECCWYARRNSAVQNGVPIEGKWSIDMHRAITGEPDGMDVDHEDGDGLNNQRWNLRIATHRQNTQNRTRLTSGKTSMFLGVCRSSSPWGKPWRAQIGIGEMGPVRAKPVALGRFDSEEDAARAYDAAARLYFGEFAALNFPDIQ